MTPVLESWGKVHYEEATRRQQETVDAVSDGAEERLIVCTHPPVVTLGRGTVPEDLAGWSGETYESTRGGRATYHGPNQIVIYPILDLKKSRRNIPERDIHAYLRALESATVEALKSVCLLNCEARLTGVWIGDKKIASIGIAVRKWITYHGVAINVLNDESAFKGINPCGFSPDVMTSLEAELGRPVNYEKIREIFSRTFISALFTSS